MIPTAYKQLVQGPFDISLHKALESTEKAWTNLQTKHRQETTHAHSYIFTRKKHAIDDNDLRYRPLRYADSIRVLELLPASSTSSPLFCCLKQGRVKDSTTSYEALSYVWGDRVSTASLYCDGKVVDITRNLEAALRHLRLVDRPRYIWVDAICINQGDISERGHQVKLMRAIYKTATRVLIWIGEDAPYVYYYSSGPRRKLAEESDVRTTTTKAAHAFDLLYQIFDHMNVKYANLKKVVTYTDSSRRKAAWEREVETKVKLERARYPTWDETWEVLEEFFSVKWWFRQWVIQEAVVASSAIVIWGHREIAWKKVGETANWLKTHYPPSRRQYIPGANNASYIYYLAMEAQQKIRLHPFLSVVVSAWNYESSDPRDRIFAMLGLPNSDSNPDQGELFIEPDYSLSTAQVYTTFARRVLEKERNLRIFNTVQHETVKSLQRPSWVPQWKPPAAEPLIPVGHIINHMPGYSLPDDAIITKDPELLVLRGLKMDTIMEPTDVIPFFGEVDTCANHADLIGSIEGFLLEQRRQLTFTCLKSLCWTLTAGRGNDLWASNVNHWNKFQELWSEICKVFATKQWSRIGATRGDNLPVSPVCHCGLYRMMGSATHGRRLFVTANGTIGLGPAILERDDVIVTLLGGFTPFVLRPEHDHYLLVGECYVHGYMNGGAIEEWEDAVEEAEQFYIR